MVNDLGLWLARHEVRIAGFELGQIGDTESICDAATNPVSFGDAQYRRPFTDQRCQTISCAEGEAIIRSFLPQ